MAESGNSMKAVKGSAMYTKSKIDLNSIAFGRIQPQAPDLEEAIIGSILIDQDALSKVEETIDERSFYKKANGKIFEAAMELYRSNNPVDLITVKDALSKKGELDEVGGIAYLAELTNKVTSGANIEYWARIVQQKFILRELIRGSSETIGDSFEDSKDVFEILNDAEKFIYDISQDNLRKGVQNAGYIASKVLKEINALAEYDDEVTGVTTGFQKLDELLGGWQKSDLVIIAARPAMGKTSFTLALAHNAAKIAQTPVAIFSLEMANEQLVQRILAMESEVGLTKIRKGKLEDHEWPKLERAVEKLTEMPLFVDDTPSLSIVELRSKCRRLKMQHGIGLIVIDYLQLMTATSKKNGTREQEISSISRALKGIAKELEVPVIALSQLSRAVETRGGSKRPLLSDLRESGAIEQDADIVSFLYRPDYYAEDNEDNDSMDPEGTTEIIVSKHRNGPTGTVKLRFLHQYTKFVDLDESLLGGDFLGAGANDGMITRQSRMNLDLGGETPF